MGDRLARVGMRLLRNRVIVPDDVATALWAYAGREPDAATGLHEAMARWASASPLYGSMPRAPWYVLQALARIEQLAAKRARAEEERRVTRLRWADIDAEYPISTVLMWYESGDVDGLYVEQAQGDRPRVSWTPPRNRSRKTRRNLSDL